MSKSTKSNPEIELVKKPKMKRSNPTKVSTIKQSQKVTVNIHSPPPVKIKKKRSSRKKIAVKPFENPFAGAREPSSVETSARNTTFGNFFQNQFGNPLPYSLILPPPPVLEPPQQQVQLRPPVFRPRVFIPSSNMINDDFVEPQFGGFPVTRPAITDFTDDGNMSPFTNDFPDSHDTTSFITPFAPVYEDDFNDSDSKSSFKQSSRVKEIQYIKRKIPVNIPPRKEVAIPQRAEVDIPQEVAIPQSAERRIRRTKEQIATAKEEARIRAMIKAGERELQERRANPQPKKIKVKKPFVV